MNRLCRVGSAIVIALQAASCAQRSAVRGAIHAGGVQYIGEQRRIFETGRADAALSLREVSHIPNLYAIGPVAGLDGEITILDSKPYVSQVRDAQGAYAVDHGFDHGAIFLVWCQQREWGESVEVPSTTTCYAELEDFVKRTALRQGVNVEEPFAFRLDGHAVEIGWHINVDRTGGQPVTRELFKKSKQAYVLSDEQVEIFGVYTENHAGSFISQGLRIHIHFASTESAATGHIDTIQPQGLILQIGRDNAQ